MTTHKQVIEAADKLAAATKKLTDGLAKDGTAIEGFADCLIAQKRWYELKLKMSLERIERMMVKKAA